MYSGCRREKRLLLCRFFDYAVLFIGVVLCRMKTPEPNAEDHFSFSIVHFPFSIFHCSFSIGNRQHSELALYGKQLE
jgi:hypothetical protein